MRWCFELGAALDGYIRVELARFCAFWKEKGF